MSMKKILGCIKKADYEYELIKEGDKIAVGISGGKDSVLLLYALSLYQRFARKNFEILGIHINMGFPNMNMSEIDKFYKELNIPYITVDNDIYSILKQHQDENGKLPCSICSRMKKAAVNQVAKENGCNKVAFAHHADDAIETFFLNMIYGGRVATFSPEMFLDNIQLQFIRPLIYAHENWISKAVKEKGIPVCKSTCPNDKHTQREVIKNMLHDIYKQYPQAKENFLLMLYNEEQFDLWHRKKILEKGKKDSSN